MLELTVADIDQDITDFEKRIEKAKDRLRALPSGWLPYAQHRKREKLRQDLQAEIEHVKRLIGYAREALNEMEV